MSVRTDVILVKYNRPDMEANTIMAVLETTQHPNYSLIAYQNTRGVALSKCWNRLIAASDAPYICLLNTDTVPTPGWLENLTNVLEQEEDVVAVVPSSNSVHLSQIDVPFPREETNWKTIFKFARSLSGFELQELPTASGMCVLFRRSMWQAIGGFDEEFFFYGEDTDFFERAAAVGRVVWHKGVYVHHYRQQSVSAAVEAGEFDFEQLAKQAEDLYYRKQRKRKERKERNESS